MKKKDLLKLLYSKISNHSVFQIHHNEKKKKNIVPIVISRVMANPDKYFKSYRV